MPLIGMKNWFMAILLSPLTHSRLPRALYPVERFLGRKPPALIYNPHGLKVVVWSEVCEIPDISSRFSHTAGLWAVQTWWSKLEVILEYGLEYGKIIYSRDTWQELNAICMIDSNMGKIGTSDMQPIPTTCMTNYLKVYWITAFMFTPDCRCTFPHPVHKYNMAAEIQWLHALCFIKSTVCNRELHTSSS